MRHIIKTITAIAAVAVLTGCSAPKKVTYLVDADNIPQEILNRQQPAVSAVLTPGDLLNIRVYGPDMAALAPFNKGMYLTPEGTVQNISTNNTNIGNSETASTDLYLISSDGDINFPTLGTIHAGGLTKEQLAQEIQARIYPKYVKTEPSVEIRLMNFKVTVLGAVKSPGVARSNNERLNILEAIALAGDLDIQGDRENILLYRTNSDGSREVHRLNLHDRNLLLSPYFNLQQNDFIYVEPNRSGKQGAWAMHQGWTSSIAIVSGLSSIAGLVIGIVNLSK